MGKTLREQAAFVLDATLEAEVRKYGTFTDSARNTLAFWLDGGRVRTAYVRKLIGYLRMIARSA